MQALLVRNRIEARYELGGEMEAYATLAFAFGEHKFEVFIYDDEAGIFKDQKWEPFERPDFDDSDRLLEALVDSLETSFAEKA